SDVLEISFKLPIGKGTVSGQDARSCSLGRALNILFEFGKPIGRINCIFFKPQSGPLRTLGTLCHTPGRQVLFFPGIPIRRLSWFTRREDKTKRPELPPLVQYLDHITLEPDFSRWHATLLTGHRVKEIKIPKWRTRKINENLLFWFSLSVRDPSVLEATPRELLIQ